ncbi:MAG: NADH-quinone oxidoreductase subunit F, partial [Gaiellaceae bacterium]
MAEAPILVLAGAEESPLRELAAYRAAGGYAQLERARAMSPQEVTQELIDSNLRGRGGAFFPMGRKASFIPTPDKIAKPIYLTVNADESEPGTFKDREIMLRVPHRLLEGCLIAAHAIQSTQVYIYIRGEYLAEYETL